MARVGIAEAAARVGEHRRGRFARAALKRAMDDLHQARAALTRAATRHQAERARAWNHGRARPRGGLAGEAARGQPLTALPPAPENLLPRLRRTSAPLRPTGRTAPNVPLP